MSPFVSNAASTITLNRPKVLNALNGRVMTEVTTAAAEFDAGQGTGAIVTTGSEKGIRRWREYPRISRRWPTCRSPTCSAAQPRRVGPHPQEHAELISRWPNFVESAAINTSHIMAGSQPPSSPIEHCGDGGRAHHGLALRCCCTALADFRSGRLEVSGPGACDDDRESITSSSQTGVVRSVWSSDGVSR
jgi:hypothetical protein